MKLKKKLKTTIERYGVECSLLNKDVKEKAKQTILDKYGVENISQLDEIKAKVKKTILEKYDGLYPLQREGKNKTN
jgi:hypothetical protein